MAAPPHQEKDLYEFGPFRLDASQRVLLRGGDLISLTPKAFDTLLALVEGEGRVVEKDQLLKRVWPDTFVEEGSLAQNISILRRMLGEYHGQPYIQTIPKRGYRLVAPVSEPRVAAEPKADNGMASNGDGKDVPTSGTRWKQWCAAAAAVLVFIAIAILWWQRRGPTPLTDRDVVVLADFTNSTVDPVFDGTLREAFAYQLEQSPFLKVLDDSGMRQDLALMRRSPEERITNGLAHDICLREADKAMLGGSIANLGKDYVIQLQATNCQTGATLAREQAEAQGKEHVLEALASAVQGMRAKLGESLSSIQKLAPPPQVERVTTSSIEAFQAYHLGRDLFSQSRFVESIPFLERATELDPELAIAWSWLASASPQFLG
jgi:DNA-binding winged helix-turn-helix (wHTH) protein